ncbi:MAG: ParA family protein [Gloeomargarita sp. SKYG116]|nr:ParA family protein [Gloeomargarita sp. SKYG116]MDW8402296.1 ParA family protein [Gloeomargarita sp. SKYGB_i_bin116]
MKVLVWWSSRGTVGKSTGAAHTIGAIAFAKKRVAWIDADPEGSLNRWLERFLKKHPQLRPFISEETDGADYLVIDCPPGDNERARQALQWASLILIPTTVGPTERERFSHLLTTLSQHAPGKLTGLILNQFDPTANEIRRFKAEILQQPNCPPILAAWPHRQAWKTAWTEGKCVWETGWGHKPAAEEWKKFEQAAWQLLGQTGW